MAAAFSASITAGTCAAPAGATVGSLSPLLFALEVNPKRLSPGVVLEHANSVRGTVKPLACRSVGNPERGIEGGHRTLSVATSTRWIASLRKPAPPIEPEWITPGASEENAGTSPLLSGVTSVASNPATWAPPRPVVDPSPSPSNPAPVATW